MNEYDRIWPNMTKKFKNTVKTLKISLTKKVFLLSVPVDCKPNLGEAGSVFEIRRRGEYQSSGI